MCLYFLLRQACMRQQSHRQVTWTEFKHWDPGSVVRYLPEHGADLFHCFILRLWDFVVDEEHEESQKDDEDDEYIASHCLL